MPELLRGVGFSITWDGPNLYLKALKRLGLYVWATYKNGFELEMCLDSEELIIPEEPVLPENPTAHQRRMWELWAAVVVKNEETLRQNLRSLYTVVMLLCKWKTRWWLMRAICKLSLLGIPWSSYRWLNNLCTRMVARSYTGYTTKLCLQSTCLGSTCLGWGKNRGQSL